MRTIIRISIGPAAVLALACGGSGTSHDGPSSDVEMSSEDSRGDSTGPSTTADSSGAATGDAEDAGTDTDASSDSGADPGEDSTLEPCDPFQPSCGDGEKCIMAGSVYHYEPVCVPIVDDPSGPGEPCSLRYVNGDVVGDDCDAGLRCDPEDFVSGVCRPLCTGTSANSGCAAGGDYCVPFTLVCVETCDPLGNECGNATCLSSWLDGPFSCAGVGTVPLGGSCDVDFCQDGLSCWYGPQVPNCQSDWCCAQYCALDEGTCDSSIGPVQCQDTGYGGVNEGLGVCLIPGVAE